MEQLGIQPWGIIWQVVNFLVLLYLLKRFLYAPVLRMLDERRKKIEDGLQSAKRMEETLQKSEKKQQEVLVAAREEGKKLIDDAKKAARRTEEELIQKAHQEAEAIIQKSHQEIAAERKQMQEQLQKESVDLAMQMLEKVLTQVLSEKEQQEIIEKRMKDISRLIQ